MNFEKQRKFFNTGETATYRFRIRQLNALKKAIKRNQKRLLEALAKDLGKSRIESYATEIQFVLLEIEEAKRNLRKWMKPEKVAKPFALFPGKSMQYKEPKGLVLIISPWNYPVNLTLAPLVAAIAAGNCCVIKPSELSVHTSKVIKKLITETYPEEYITCVLGDADLVTRILKERFDHIFFTGSTRIGKIVMEAAAKHLTSVTLELGGKSPCIVDRSANLTKAAFWIVFGKYVNAGQTCIAPDYVLVEKSVEKALKKRIIQMLRCFEKVYPATKQEKEDIRIGAIIQKQHYKRLVSFIENGRVLYGGVTEKRKNKISLTVLDRVKVNSPVMQEEIFGPILPILTWKTEEELLKVVHHYEKPLACYIFTKRKSFFERMNRSISFGGGCCNATLLHIANSNMGFGGAGESGIGQYHGKRGFLELSHMKSMVKR